MRKSTKVQKHKNENTQESESIKKLEAIANNTPRSLEQVFELKKKKIIIIIRMSTPSSKSVNAKRRTKILAQISLQE